MKKREITETNIITFVVLIIIIIIASMVHLIIKYSTDNNPPITNQTNSNSTIFLQQKCLAIKIKPLNCTSTSNQISLI